MTRGIAYSLELKDTLTGFEGIRSEFLWVISWLYIYKDLLLYIKHT